MQTELVNRFLEFLKSERQVSVNTLQSYKRDIAQFIAYLTEQGKSDILTSDSKTFVEYIVYMQKKGRSASTVLRNMASLRALYRYLAKNSIVDRDPTVEVPLPKSEKKLPQIMTMREVESLIEQPDDKDVKGARDKAMLEILYATGLRVSEMIGLNISDLDLENHVITTRRNGRAREIPLGKYAQKAIENYIKVSRPVLIRNQNEEALFLNIGGTRLTRQGFWKIIKYYKNCAKIDKDITPHTLRHSFAAHLVQNGADIKSIQELLGHSDISSTQVYTKLNKDGIQGVYRLAHPRA